MPSLIQKAILMVASIALAAAPAFPLDDEWQTLTPDLELMRFDVSSYLFFSSSVVLLRSNLKSFQLGVIRAEEYGQRRDSVKSLVKRARAVAGINANFFDDRGNPLGLVISRGITHHKLHKGGRTLSGVFAVTSGGVLIANRSAFDARPALEAVQAGPRLIEHGKAIPGLIDTSPHSRRAGVCIDASRRVVLYTVTSSLYGISLDRLIELLRSDPIRCVEALNLDGGGSAQFYLNPMPRPDGRLPEISIEGDDVPVVLGLFPR